MYDIISLPHDIINECNAIHRMSIMGYSDVAVRRAIAVLQHAIDEYQGNVTIGTKFHQAVAILKYTKLMTDPEITKQLLYVVEDLIKDAYALILVR